MPRVHACLHLASVSMVALGLGLASGSAHCLAQDCVGGAREGSVIDEGYVGGPAINGGSVDGEILEGCDGPECDAARNLATAAVPGLAVATSPTPRAMLHRACDAASRFSKENLNPTRKLRHSYTNDLFHNYYVGPSPSAGGMAAQMYLSPRPTPPLVGHTYTTYQPLMPHEMLYRHRRTYWTHRPSAGWTRTKVSYGHSPLSNWATWAFH